MSMAQKRSRARAILDRPVIGPCELRPVTGFVRARVQAERNFAVPLDKGQREGWGRRVPTPYLSTIQPQACGFPPPFDWKPREDLHHSALTYL
jgi:hypothetical protein